MKKTTVFFLIWLVMFFFITNKTLATENKKVAQSGFQFLSVISDGKAAAMAGAVNSLEMQSSSLFFNPAGMANQASLMDISLSNNRWIADRLKYFNKIIGGTFIGAGIGLASSNN